MSARVGVAALPCAKDAGCNSLSTMDPLDVCIGRACLDGADDAAGPETPSTALDGWLQTSNEDGRTATPSASAIFSDTQTEIRTEGSALQQTPTHGFMSSSQDGSLGSLGDHTWASERSRRSSASGPSRNSSVTGGAGINGLPRSSRSPHRGTGGTTGGTSTPQRRGSAPATSGGVPTPPVPRSSLRTDGSKGDVALCVRLRPGCNDQPTCLLDGTNGVRLRSGVGCRADTTEMTYRCDLAWGPDTTQEQVFSQGVTPICDAVLRGYNGAVIAYGQTGSGKTHTMLGDSRGHQQGVAPRSVDTIFSELSRTPCWRVAVTVLEIYNERVRDLLAPGTANAMVDLHEVTGATGVCFQCPDALSRTVQTPEEALAALQEGMRRRETAYTDMNHNSSRSHLIFTLCITQSDTQAGATLRSRLHLVDLAGSERLKRSMATDGSASGNQSSRQIPRAPGTSPRTPRDHRRETGEINKSLSQLALVIQRLTTSGSLMVPYRDSVLTRLLAESFGGSSKTCLIITCSAHMEDREETKISLDFGKRAKLVKNTPEINLEVQNEPSEVFKALVAKEVQFLRRECDHLSSERTRLEEKRLADAKRYEQEKDEMRRMLIDALAEAAEVQESSRQAAARCEEERTSLEGRLQEAVEALRQIKETRDTNAVDAVRLRVREEELVKSLEDKSAEVTKADAEIAELRAKLDEELSRRLREQAAMAARSEMEKTALQQHWQVAASEAWRVLQEKAPQLSQIQSTVGKSEKWSIDSALAYDSAETSSSRRRDSGSTDLGDSDKKQADAARNEVELTPLDGLLQKHREAEASNAQLQDEIASLRHQLNVSHKDPNVKESERRRDPSLEGMPEHARRPSGSPRRHSRQGPQSGKLQSPQTPQSPRALVVEPLQLALPLHLQVLSPRPHYRPMLADQEEVVQRQVPSPRHPHRPPAEEEMSPHHHGLAQPQLVLTHTQQTPPPPQQQRVLSVDNRPRSQILQDALAAMFLEAPTAPALTTAAEDLATCGTPTSQQGSPRRSPALRSPPRSPTRMLVTRQASHGAGSSAAYGGVADTGGSLMLGSLAAARQARHTSHSVDGSVPMSKTVEELNEVGRQLRSGGVPDTMSTSFSSDGQDWTELGRAASPADRAMAKSRLWSSPHRLGVAR